MKTRSRRQIGRRTDSGQALFGGTGWLFADLMVALAMAFLVATTVGFPTPPPKPPAHRVTGAHPGRHPATKPPQPALDFSWIDIKITIDPNDLLNNGTATETQIRNVISTNRDLASHCTGKFKSGCVGLVLLFGGVLAGGQSDYTNAGHLDNAVWKILTTELGPESSLFHLAVPRDFYNPTEANTLFELNIYVFKNP